MSYQQTGRKDYWKCARCGAFVREVCEITTTTPKVYECARCGKLTPHEITPRWRMAP